MTFLAVEECRARALDLSNTSATKLSDLQAEEGGFDVHHLGPIIERKQTSEDILVARSKARRERKRREEKENRKKKERRKEKEHRKEKKHHEEDPQPSKQDDSSETTPAADDVAPGPIKIGPPKGKKRNSSKFEGVTDATNSASTTNNNAVTTPSDAVITADAVVDTIRPVDTASDVTKNDDNNTANTPNDTVNAMDTASITISTTNTTDNSTEADNTPVTTLDTTNKTIDAPDTTDNTISFPSTTHAGVTSTSSVQQNESDSSTPDANAGATSSLSVTAPNNVVSKSADDGDDISSWTSTPTASPRVDQASKHSKDHDDISSWPSSPPFRSNGTGGHTALPNRIENAKDGVNMSSSLPSRSPSPVPSRSSTPMPPTSTSVQKENRAATTSKFPAVSEYWILPFILETHSPSLGLEPSTPPRSLVNNTQKASPIPLPSKPPGAAPMLEYSDDEDDTMPPAGKSVHKRKSNDAVDNNSTIATPKKKAKTTAPSSKRKLQASEGGSKKKRQKLSIDDFKHLELAFDVVIPDNHADWVPGAVALLASMDFGAQWKTLIQAWLSFEHSRKYAATTLPAANRPSAVGDWINRARPYTYRPAINVKTFESSFKTWWISFQPEWRHANGNGQLAKSGDGSWNGMEYTGVNGLLSVLAALFFWGMSGTSKQWCAAVDDVVYALQSMI